MPVSKFRPGTVAVQQANRASNYGSNAQVRQSGTTERSTRQRVATGPSDQITRTPNIEAPPPSRYLSEKRYNRLLEWLEDLPIRRTCRIPLVVRCLSTEETPAMADIPVITTARTAKDGVRHSAYRSILRGNGIIMLDAYDEPPQYVQDLLEGLEPAEPVTKAGRIQTAKLKSGAIRGMNEVRVKTVFGTLITDRIDETRLEIMGDKLLDPLRVPNKANETRIVTPKPDWHLGYKVECFDNELQGLLRDFDPNIAKFAFLDVELKGDGDTSLGSLWVATNQCMGGSATFLNILNRLKSTLHDNKLAKEANALQPVIYSVASNGTEARLFATYSSGEGDFIMHLVKGFLMYDASSKATLDAYIQRIIDWGTDERLPMIKSALQALRKSGVRGSKPAPPTISGNEENEDPDSSDTNQTYMRISEASIARSDAENEEVPEPRQTRSRKRAADTQPSKRKRRKATGA